MTALLLLAVSSRILLFDETFSIPANEWRFVDFVLKQQPATLECRFEVKSGTSPVKAAIIRKADLEKLRAGGEPEPVIETKPGKSGDLRRRLPSPGEYALLVDNRAPSSKAAEVEMRASLDFSAKPAREARFLDPARRLAVVLISVGAFFSIFTYSLIRLWRGIR